jgi:hypothetical protein
MLKKFSFMCGDIRREIDFSGSRNIHDLLLELDSRGRRGRRALRSFPVRWQKNMRKMQDQNNFGG